MSKREVVFVFGSNLAGRHGKGAAWEANKFWGAEYGVGRGRTGDAYAIPTKDKHLKPLSLADIKEYYDEFWEYAKEHPKVTFLLTPAGSGLAGYSLDQIKEITVRKRAVPRNVWLTGDWFR